MSGVKREDIRLQAGDVFCCTGNMPVVSRLIRAIEWLWSKDNEASYGHAGIITSNMGNTIEALWTVKAARLGYYDGQKVIIARPRMTENGGYIAPSDKARALEKMEKYLGRWYPLWRLPLHLVPPLAKLVATGNNMVCSELVARYLQEISARPGPYTGVNPDTLADEWRRWKNFTIVYEGEWQWVI